MLVPFHGVQATVLRSPPNAVLRCSHFGIVNRGVRVPTITKRLRTCVELSWLLAFIVLLSFAVLLDAYSWQNRSAWGATPSVTKTG